MAFGTLMPPIFAGEIGEIAREHSGQIILLGIAVCMLGIVLSGLAGMSKERELTDAQKKNTVKEFHFGKGLLVAIFAGVMSSCFAYGLTAGKPIGMLTKDYLLQTGRADLWQNLPILVVLLWGGFTTNFIWCSKRFWKNKTAGQFLGRAGGKLSGSQEAHVEADGSSPSRIDSKTMMLNTLLAAATGLMWYFQFFFTSMGQTKWVSTISPVGPCNTASIIIFSPAVGCDLQRVEKHQPPDDCSCNPRAGNSGALDDGRRIRKLSESDDEQLVRVLICDCAGTLLLETRRARISRALSLWCAYPRN